MRNTILKNAVYLLMAVSALAWVALAHFGKLDLSKVGDFLGLLPKVVSIDLFLVALFIKWGWRCRWFRGWLVPFPDLSGTWVGNIYSDWKDPKTGAKPAPIPVMLTVSQSYFHISCVMRTGEMESSSYAEGFLIDNDRQVKKLAYSYASRPRLSLSDRSVPHDGAAVLQIIEKPNRKLSGRYWTERLTKGEIILEFHSDELLEEIPPSVGEHPVTEPENRR